MTWQRKWTEIKQFHNSVLVALKKNLVIVFEQLTSLAGHRLSYLFADLQTKGSSKVFEEKSLLRPFYHLNSRCSTWQSLEGKEIVRAVILLVGYTENSYNVSMHRNLELRLKQLKAVAATSFVFKIQAAKWYWRDEYFLRMFHPNYAFLVF